MKRAALTALLLCCAALLPAAERGLMSTGAMRENARFKDRVVAKGEVVKQVSFDVFIINDGTGDTRIDMTGLKQNLKRGDALTVYGKYDEGIRVLEFAMAGDAEAERKIIERHPAAKIDAEPKQTEPPAKSDVRSRLEQLERLRGDNLVSPEEYQEQRKRILNDL